ncbi:MAG: Holliday junction resolvase RuvX [Bacteroidetes bacterium]|nr:MAG: Holliday junction resolvase RuvX [Bacteroidota bacterium]
MGKVLAIDFGLKRTGLALSDESQIFAFGHGTVESRHLLSELKTLIAREKVSQIVLGLPKRMNLEDSHITENVHLLKEKLIQEFHLPVELYDERFTSKMASQAIELSGASRKKRQDKALVDEVSATIILQSYLASKG